MCSGRTMFTFFKAETIEYLQSSLLGSCDFLIHAFCTRRGGTSRDDYRSLNMSFAEGDEEYRVLQNWGRLSAAFRIPLDQFLVVNQVHGDSVFVIKPHGPYFSSRAELNYDAIVTNRTDLAICVKTADCVPVFVTDKIKKIIAVIHAGRRSSALNITAKVVRLMQNRYQSEPQDLLAAIGPAIGKCCYEIDAAAASPFSKQHDSRFFLLPGLKKESRLLNLGEVNRRQLLECRIPEENIEISGLCTKCNPDFFFSHRAAGGVTGRQINFLMIRSEKPCRVLAAEDEPRRIQ